MPDLDMLAQGFIEAHGGDPARALLTLARAGQLAVHYLDRDVIEGRRRKFTDAEWELLVPELEEYDQWFDELGSEIFGAFIDNALTTVGVPEEAVTCPTDPLQTNGEPHTVIGCGSGEVAGPDDEGLYDCLACGMFFDPKRERRIAPTVSSSP